MLKEFGHEDSKKEVRPMETPVVSKARAISIKKSKT